MTTVCVWMALVCPAQSLVVESDFPGGSAEVVEIDQAKRSVRINPADHPQRGWRCWWYFKLEGIQPGETITVDVGDAPWATPDRATFSTDGSHWIHTAPGIRSGKRIVYEQKVDAEQAWFAWGPPFVLEDAHALVREAAKSLPTIKPFTLCMTRENRPTPALRMEPANPEFGIWIQARQHAWESGASWVCKGFVDWVVSDDPRAKILREKATIVVVPIMDVDNVVRGAGGKNEFPQDHNRDWTDKPHWKAVAATQKGIKQLDELGRMHLFVDLHNPSAQDKQPYFYIAPKELLSPAGSHNLNRFLQSAREEITGPLAFRGRIIESGTQYDPKAWKAISKNWVTEHCQDHVVALTLETAWNTPASTTEGYLRIGRELGMAIERYLRQDLQY